MFIYLFIKFYLDTGIDVVNVADERQYKWDEQQNPNLTTKEELLKEHKKRWGKVAQRWRLQSKVNDRRYAESYKQLHEMAKNLLAYDD